MMDREESIPNRIGEVKKRGTETEINEYDVEERNQGLRCIVIEKTGKGRIVGLIMDDRAFHLDPRARRRACGMGSYPGKRQDGGRIGRRRVIHQEEDVDAPNVIKGLVPGVRARPKLSEPPKRLPPKNVNIKSGLDKSHCPLAQGKERAKTVGEDCYDPACRAANPDGTSWAERAQHAGVNTYVVNPRHMREVYARYLMEREYAYLRYRKGEVERSIRGLRRVLGLLKREEAGAPETRDLHNYLWEHTPGRRDIPVPEPDPRSHPIVAFVASWRPHPRFNLVRRINTLRERVGTLDSMMCRLRAMVRRKLTPAALGARRHDVLCRIASYQFPPVGLTWDEPLTRRWELRSYPDPLPRYLGWCQGYRD
ncbi:hypothetical protein Bbelb_111460 [Branchiostoma belcheri]|nr:hypothetical protein Bbelb_111460 [Branchiostoma belcheri]